ncbi:MAG: hypothetical protein GY788_22110 [bacterium]|nr:hypothetical protein [bacterium]
MKGLDLEQGEQGRIEKQPTPIPTPSAFNYEQDSLRFVFELLLREYEFIRQEYDIAVRRIDQNFGFMFALMVAILATQLPTSISESINQFLVDNRIILLVGAIVLLWFPVNNAVLKSDLLAAALYNSEVYVPKVQRLAEQREIASEAGLVYLDWVVETFEPNHQGPFAWDSYRADVLFRGGVRYAQLRVLWLAKDALLYLPSTALTFLYIRDNVDGLTGDPLPLIDYILLLLLFVGAAWTFTATQTTGNLSSIYRANRS